MPASGRTNAPDRLSGEYRVGGPIAVIHFALLSWGAKRGHSIDDETNPIDHSDSGVRGLFGLLDRERGSCPRLQATRDRTREAGRLIIVNVETKQSTRYWSLLKETPGLDNIGDVSFLRHD
jgi:hypothetical protein